MSDSRHLAGCEDLEGVGRIDEYDNAELKAKVVLACERKSPDLSVWWANRITGWAPIARHVGLTVGQVLMFAPGDTRDEHDLHEELTEYRRIGEWFERNDSVLDALRAYAAERSGACL